MITSTHVAIMLITFLDNIPFQGYSHMVNQRYTQSVDYIVFCLNEKQEA